MVEVPLQYAIEAIKHGKWGDHWTFGYAMMVHSSQGLIIFDPQNVWIEDDFLKWSNLACLVVSRVQHLTQLERCCPPPAYNEVTARKNIGRKLQAYKRVDPTKGLKCHMKDIESLKEQRKSTGVPHATSRCSGAMPPRTRGSYLSTESTMPGATVETMPTSPVSSATENKEWNYWPTGKGEPNQLGQQSWTPSWTSKLLN